MTLEIVKGAHMGMGARSITRDTEGRNRKVLAHRHERRKMRESLKRWDGEDAAD